MTEMKPYDPEHKGEFCTRDGKAVRIVATDMKCYYPIVGIAASTYASTEAVYSWMADGTHIEGHEGHKWDLMCVIPKREARVIVFDADRALVSDVPAEGFRDVTFREVMPDDISQEKARAVIEAARVAYKYLLKYWPSVTRVNAVESLRAALGDDV